MLRSTMKAALAAAFALAALIPAPAEAGVRIGTLACDIAGGAGLIIASRKELVCEFDGLGGVRDEEYVGSITKVGIDVGGTAAARLLWAVFAPTSRVGPGVLEGRYYGVSAEATPGVGIGANVLIGGFDQSINLQPISIQGQLGANIAAGIAGLRLISAPQAPIVRKH
jgi:hypothetical protein